MRGKGPHLCFGVSKSQGLPRETSLVLCAWLFLDRRNCRRWKKLQLKAIHTHSRIQPFKRSSIQQFNHSSIQLRLPPPMPRRSTKAHQGPSRPLGHKRQPTRNGIPTLNQPTNLTFQHSDTTLRPSPYPNIHPPI